MGAVGAFDRQPRRRCRAGRLADAAKRRRPQPRSGWRGASVRRCGISCDEVRPRREWQRTTFRSLLTVFLRGSGTSDSKKPAAITKQSSATTSASNLRGRGQPFGMVVRCFRRRNQVHAGHRGVVHARDRKRRTRPRSAPVARRPAAPGRRAVRHRPSAIAISTDSTTIDSIMGHGEMARQTVHADIMHAGDADAEQHRRGQHAQKRAARRR